MPRYTLKCWVLFQVLSMRSHTVLKTILQSGYKPSFNTTKTEAEEEKKRGRKKWDSLKSSHVSTSVSLTMLKALTMWSTTNGGKFLKRWEYQTTLPASWETCVQVKKQQIEPQIEQWTGSKMGQEYFKAVLQPCLFNLYAEYLMWNNGLDEAHLESRLLGEISTTSDRQMLPL